MNRFRVFESLASVVLLLGGLTACDNGPFEVGRPMLLGRINGQPLPWVAPGDTSTNPTAITEGWFTLLEGGRAERHERFGRWIVNVGGDSTPVFAEWTQSGPYHRLPGRIIVTYPAWARGEFGPAAPVETLYVTSRGVVLRVTGFVPPLDSMVRVYCADTPPC